MAKVTAVFSAVGNDGGKENRVVDSAQSYLGMVVRMPDATIQGN